MKKFTQIAVFAVVVAALFATMGCKGVSKKRPEGWINNDTFRTQVIGYAPEGSDRKWQAESKTAAEIVAAETIMRKMVGSWVESTGATENNELIGKVVKEKAAGSIVGWNIVEVTYDEGTKSCTLTAELTKKDLKKDMDDRITQWINELKQQQVAAPVLSE